MQLKQFLYSTDKTEIQAYLWATEDCSVPFNAISGLLVKLYLYISTDIMKKMFQCPQAQKRPVIFGV